ncbi:MAG: hypothetical protein PVH91_16890 [Pseudomonadales bacterium]|jgi:hypothetical protein
METSSLLWGLLFGSIGVAYVMYGRRQSILVPLVSGLALIGFPYFVSNTSTMIVIGVLLIAAPFVIKL